MEKKEFIYWLPDKKSGERKEFKTEKNSLVIIGANGAGKSKLGAWIEKKNYEKVHRIGAQRNLFFDERINLKDLKTSQFLCFWGEEINNGNKWPRWNGDRRETTQELNDFQYVLSALIAFEHADNKRISDRYRECLRNKQCPTENIKTTIDKLIEIWSDVFPNCEISLVDDRFYARNKLCIKKNKTDETEIDNNVGKYYANQMSDGERVALYLVGQVLCVPSDVTLIVDEPEIHLHRSLMNRLWKKLEEYRPDCFFIYITHDTQFASSHNPSVKVWLKGFDGKLWDWDFIEKSELPEQLLLDILGNRKKVLFVEGDTGSYDLQLFNRIYPNYYVVPCGSCEQVIERTKAFKSTAQLHDCNVFGIIDRDYRSEEELNNLATKGIYPLKVAEIENMFLVEEVMSIVQERMKRADGVDKAKDFIIDTKFRNYIKTQINKSAMMQIKYRLSRIELDGKNDNELKGSLQEEYKKINVDEIYQRQRDIFNDALGKRVYEKILRLFNQKGLADESGFNSCFGLKENEYVNMVLRLLEDSNTRSSVVEAFKKYVPEEIPFE